MTTALIVLVVILIVSAAELARRLGHAHHLYECKHSKLAHLTEAHRIAKDARDHWKRTAQSKGELLAAEMIQHRNETESLTERLHRAERTVERVRAAMSDDEVHDFVKMPAIGNQVEGSYTLTATPTHEPTKSSTNPKG